jgi:hypothetical protein
MAVAFYSHSNVDRKRQFGVNRGSSYNDRHLRKNRRRHVCVLNQDVHLRVQRIISNNDGSLHPKAVNIAVTVKPVKSSGADGGGRTHTSSRIPDFESGASANSATSATVDFTDDYRCNGKYCGRKKVNSKCIRPG